MPQRAVAERLSDQDIENLVSEMLDLSSGNPKASFPSLFTQAQMKVLPPHKRYTREVVYQRSKWTKRLQDALKGAGLWPGYQPPEEIEPAPAAVPAVIPVRVAESPTDTLAKLYEAILSDVWKRMLPEIERQVESRFNALLLTAEQHQGQAFIEHEVEDGAGTVTILHKPVSVARVFVVGLIPEQIVALRHKLVGVPVDLRFWKNEAQTKLAEYADWADDIIIMSKFVSHSDIHAVRNKGRNKIKYCNGAVSELERQIRFTISEKTT